MTPTFKPTGAGTRIYLPKNVYDAALERMELLFSEFENVIVRVSGGKDSTVIFHLAMQVATALKRLPLKVYWLDQEAEWASTVENVRALMYRDDVDPMWLQVPFRIFNASSQTDHWLHAWDPAARDRWMHEQDPIAVKENTFGTDRFVGLFHATLKHAFGDRPAASIAGVRAEESPNRRKGLTHFKTYKWITWGSVTDRRREQFTFYPIYDWSFTDVWHAIHSNEWPYSTLYDRQYAYGIPLRSMRVSNLHHETAVKSLFHLQEFEPETYERLTQRIGGIDTAGKLGEADYFPDELPFMFADWGEYRDYLFEHLVEPEYRPLMAKKFAEHDRKLPRSEHERAHRMHVRAILTCDWEGVKLDNFFLSPQTWQAVKDNRPNWKRAA